MLRRPTGCFLAPIAFLWAFQSAVGARVGEINRLYEKVTFTRCHRNGRAAIRSRSLMDNPIALFLAQSDGVLDSFAEGGRQESFMSPSDVDRILQVSICGGSRWRCRGG